MATLLERLRPIQIVMVSRLQRIVMPMVIPQEQQRAIQIDMEILRHRILIYTEEIGAQQTAIQTSSVTPQRTIRTAMASPSVLHQVIPIPLEIRPQASEAITQIPASGVGRTLSPL